MVVVVVAVVVDVQKQWAIDKKVIIGFNSSNTVIRTIIRSQFFFRLAVAIVSIVEEQEVAVA